MDVMYLGVYFTHEANLMYLVKHWAHPAARTPQPSPHSDRAASK